VRSDHGKTGGSHEGPGVSATARHGLRAALAHGVVRWVDEDSRSQNDSRVPEHRRRSPMHCKFPRDDTEHWPDTGRLMIFAASLRGRLAQCPERSRSSVGTIVWTRRFEQVCGRADVAMTAFPDRTAAPPRRGDYFGVHAHFRCAGPKSANSGYTISTTDSGCATARIRARCVYRMQRITDQALFDRARAYVQ